MARSELEKVRPVKGYEGLYEVSDTGRVFSLNYRNTKKISELKLALNPSGYQFVSLWADREMRQHSVHRLVAKAFIENPEYKRTVNHKNGIRTDNRVENLEWHTHSENHKHAFDVLKRRPNALGDFGGDHPTAKSIHQYTKCNIFIKSYRSLTDAARETGAKKSCISSNASGKIKSAGGFVWRYQ